MVFNAFSLNPKNTCFETQEKGEKIIFLLRAHPITQIPWILSVSILLILPVFFFWILGNFSSFGLFPFYTWLVLVLVWYLFVFGFSFFKFLFWYFNVHILTNERIIDFDFHGIIHKVISFASLSQIQDVNPKTFGVFSTLFDFGNLHIRTASAIPEFEFRSIPKPDLAAREVMREARLEEAETPGEIK